MHEEGHRISLKESVFSTKNQEQYNTISAFGDEKGCLQPKVEIMLLGVGCK